MRLLLDLYRRRKLAYQLLDEYDAEPMTWDEAVAKINAYAASGNWTTANHAVGAWREAAEAKKGAWPSD